MSQSVFGRDLFQGTLLDGGGVSSSLFGAELVGLCVSGDSCAGRRWLASPHGREVAAGCHFDVAQVGVAAPSLCCCVSPCCPQRALCSLDCQEYHRLHLQRPATQPVIQRGPLARGNKDFIPATPFRTPARYPIT